MGKGFRTIRHPVGVEPVKLGLVDINLAPQLDEIGYDRRSAIRPRAAQLLWQHGDRANVARNVIALESIATSRSVREHTPVVGETDGEPVILGLDHEREILAAEARDDPGMKRPPFRLGVSLVQAQHGQAVDVRRKPAAAIITHPRRVRPFRMCVLQGREFAFQLVVVGIGNLRGRLLEI